MRKHSLFRWDNQTSYPKYALYTEATIHFEELHAYCSEHQEEDVVIAFIEGWHLGGYEFLTYKKETEKVAPILKFDLKGTVKLLISGK